MAEFIVHTIPGSPFARAVLMAVEEKNASWSVAALDFPDLTSGAYPKLHPFGKIPTLEHKGFMLYETQAILRYVDRILPEPALTPSGPRSAARMDQLMNIHDWYLFPQCARTIGFERKVAPVLGRAPDEAAIAAAAARAPLVLKTLSDALADNPYFTGGEICLADLMIGAQLDFMADTPEWDALAEASPNLRDYLSRMLSRPSMQKTTQERVAASAAQNPSG